jgi:hypothetical protein
MKSNPDLFHLQQFQQQKTINHRLKQATTKTERERKIVLLLHTRNRYRKTQQKKERSFYLATFVLCA